MEIYVDVLIFTNIIINYCILCATQKFLHIKLNHFRIILSAVISSTFSLVAIVPTLKGIFITCFKLLGCAVMCLIAFKFSNYKMLFKTIFCTFTISMLFCAMMIIFHQTVKPHNLAILNDTVYIQTNPVVLILISIIIYLAIILIKTILGQSVADTLVELKILLDNKEYSCTGKIDTACYVTEPFSGAPVIIAEKSILTDLQTDKKRIIPYKVLGSTSLMYGVKADKVIIDNKEVNKEIYIGLFDGSIDEQFKAIINYQITR